MDYPILSATISLLLTLAQVTTYNSPDCPKIYQRFSTSHTYCQPKNQSCDIIRSNLTQQEINQVVQLHNSYRSVIATQQKGSNGLPPAADMLFMEWDSELAAIAQRHSDSCIYAHDEGDQRRVRNFGVGQNIAKQTFFAQPPPPDWSWAIGVFFNEIEHFSSNMICGSRDLKPNQGVIGHFTQVVWSRTFRIGCGYTMFKEGNAYIRHYVCNYGPAGNVGGSCVYKQGSACSKCPSNTQCTMGAQYPGLCKRINNEAPYLPIKAPHFFNCNFMNPSSPDCLFYSTGENSWNNVPALDGNYLETVLQPGQKGSIVFVKRLTASSDAKSMCVQIRFRKGPNLAKDSQNNVANAVFTVPAFNDWTATLKFPNYEGGFQKQFTSYSLSLGWKATSEMKIDFAVPRGASPQYINIASVVGFNNNCKDVEE